LNSKAEKQKRTPINTVSKEPLVCETKFWIDSKEQEPVERYIKENPNSNRQEEKEPVIKYFIPASVEYSEFH